HERRIRNEQFEEEEEEDDDFEELSLRSDNDTKIVKDIDKPSMQNGNYMNTGNDQSSAAMMIDSSPRNGSISINETNDMDEGPNNSTRASVDQRIQISDEEREQLRADLVDIMRERFFAGNDPDFDYDAVDFNEEYDDLNVEEQEIHENRASGRKRSIINSSFIKAIVKERIILALVFE
ncbi:13736_t:CDS:2, partial [Racocetra fulgida]